MCQGPPAQTPAHFTSFFFSTFSYVRTRARRSPENPGFCPASSSCQSPHSPSAPGRALNTQCVPGWCPLPSSGPSPAGRDRQEGVSQGQRQNRTHMTLLLVKTKLHPSVTKEVPDTTFKSPAAPEAEGKAVVRAGRDPSC